MSAIESPETYSQLEDKLDDGNNLFQCSNCGHYAGDPRPRNFVAECPACNHIVRFFRLIE
mgnify:CR=1 FL=1